jgi:hypothetical protein
MVLVLAAGVLQRRRRLHPDLAWCALGLAGFIPIMAAQAIQAHDPVAFVSSQSGWGIAFATPWHTLTASLHSYVHDGGPGVAGWAWSTVSNIGSPRDLVASYLLIALIIVAFYRAWPWTARTMMLAMVLLPLSGGVPLAMSRYVLAAWPGFGVGAELLDRAPRVVRWGIVLLLVAVSILVLHDFAAGLYEG